MRIDQINNVSLYVVIKMEEGRRRSQVIVMTCTDTVNLTVLNFFLFSLKH